MSENCVREKATGKLSVLDTKPNYNMTFHRDGKQIGVLDFNGPEMVFSGDMDESAKVFFDWIARAFKGRLEQERAAEREECAQIADAEASIEGIAQHIAAAIRARENT